jgi:hypothetical protein
VGREEEALFKHERHEPGLSPRSLDPVKACPMPPPPFSPDSEKSGKSTISLKKEEKNKFFCFSEFVTSIFWTDCLDKQYLNRT